MAKIYLRNKDDKLVCLGEPKFEIGELVFTKGVSNAAVEDEAFDIFVNYCLKRYLQCDWGDTCDEDKVQNNESVLAGERILASYIYPKTKEKIWIITEWDRSATTVLFPEEY